MADGPDAGNTPTSRVIEEAAARLLLRDGVLSGLNLREVADEAGVNRALVYHYFGSRRTLLRSALRSGARQRLGAVAAGHHVGIVERFSRFLQLMIRQRSAVEMTTLLLLDGDDALKVMPLRDQTVASLQRDRDNGVIDVDDVDALHVALISLVYGYVAYRTAVARELDVAEPDLDERVGAVLERLIRGLEGGPRTR